MKIKWKNDFTNTILLYDPMRVWAWVAVSINLLSRSGPHQRSKSCRNPYPPRCKMWTAALWPTPEATPYPWPCAWSPAEPQKTGWSSNPGNSCHRRASHSMMYSDGGLPLPVLPTRGRPQNPLCRIDMPDMPQVFSRSSSLNYGWVWIIHGYSQFIVWANYPTVQVAPDFPRAHTPTGHQLLSKPS